MLLEFRSVSPTLARLCLLTTWTCKDTRTWRTKATCSRRGGKKNLTLDLLGHIYRLMWGIFIDLVHFHLPPPERISSPALQQQQCPPQQQQSRGVHLRKPKRKRKAKAWGVRTPEVVSADRDLCSLSLFPYGSHSSAACVVKHTLGNKIRVNLQRSKQSSC